MLVCLGQARRACEMEFWEEDQKEGLIGNFPTAPEMLWGPCQLMLLLQLVKIFRHFLIIYTISIPFVHIWEKHEIYVT
jgi:hypothetical protein